MASQTPHHTAATPGPAVAAAASEPTGSARADALPACPVETTLTLIRDKWTVLVLRELLTGTKRFGELKRALGHVSQKVLTARLREMEESGLVTRTVYAEVPPRVEYALTPLGQSLQPVLSAMWDWGCGYQHAREPERPSTLPKPWE